MYYTSLFSNFHGEIIYFTGQQCQKCHSTNNVVFYYHSLIDICNSETFIKIRTVFFLINMEIECLLCSDEQTEDNQIIKCKNCSFSAHVLCYGIPDAGNFICAPCRENQCADDIECAICLKKGGVLKTTTNQKWAHVMCTLFMKGAEFVDSQSMEPIDISNCKLNKKLKCTFCDATFGVLKCKKRGCQKNLHVSCGLSHGTLREILNTKDDDKTLMFIGFCAEHAKSDEESGKRLSADHIKRVLHSKTRKRQQLQAAKSNAEWIKDQIENEDEDEASFICPNDDGSDDLEQIIAENSNCSNSQHIENSIITHDGDDVQPKESHPENTDIDAASFVNVEHLSNQNDNNGCTEDSLKESDAQNPHQCYKDHHIKRVSISKSIVNFSNSFILTFYQIYI